MRLGAAAEDGDLACVKHAKRHLISRVYFTPRGVVVTDEQCQTRELPGGSFEIIGLVEDVCKGKPDCAHRDHPVALKNARPKPRHLPANVYDFQMWRTLRRVHTAESTGRIVARRGSIPKREARKPKGGAR